MCIFMCTYIHTIIYPQDAAGKLPDCLCVQMDNICRDNKDKYTLAYFALMVELGLFRKVWMYEGIKRLTYVLYALMWMNETYIAWLQYLLLYVADNVPILTSTF